MQMILKHALRPCLIFDTKSDGKRYSEKALFHRWVEYEDPLAYQRKGVRGLVELEDGSMKDVAPSQIKFLDPEHGEYDFGIKEEDENGV